jgi:hypothetical protein
LTVDPLKWKRRIVAAGRRYNGVAGQRERILARLRQGPATRQELEREANCLSVTKRVSELRGLGWPIKSAWAEEAGPDGSVSATAVYSLGGEPDSRQLGLPLA